MCWAHVVMMPASLCSDRLPGHQQRQLRAVQITLFMCHPAITMLLAWLFLGEPLVLKAVAGIACSLVGVVLVTQPPALFGGHDNWTRKRILGRAPLIAQGVTFPHCCCEAEGAVQLPAASHADQGVRPPQTRPGMQSASKPGWTGACSSSHAHLRLELSGCRPGSCSWVSRSVSCSGSVSKFWSRLMHFPKLNEKPGILRGQV